MEAKKTSQAQQNTMPYQRPPWPPNWPEIEQAVLEVIHSGQWGQYRSEICRQLQQQLGEQFDSEHVRLCGSGSVAMEIALRAAGVGPGDEVIVAAYDYPGNFRAIELVGAKPVLIDVSKHSLCGDPQQLDAAAGDQVKAVIISHLCGVAAEVDRIRGRCERYGWVLIEDACQVPGMTIDPLAQQARSEDPAAPGGRPAGSWGHLATLSFGGSKPLTAGCGGAVLTDQTRLAARFGPLLDRPSDATPLSPLQAAVLGPQLNRLQQVNRARFETVRFLVDQVLGKLSRWQWLSPIQAGVWPAYYKIAFAAPHAVSRDKTVSRASEWGLPIGVGFRAMDRSSQRRCRKPVPLDNAARFGETVFTLDHSALLIGPDRYDELAEYLVRLHDAP